MSPISFVLLALLAGPLALAHPITLDNSTLVQNGLDAQRLNAEFLTLQKNSSCSTGQTACIDGDFASCSNNVWQTQACPDSKTCFALPLITNNGTFVACTSERNAESIIDATGTQGGLISPTPSNSTVDFPLEGAANSTSTGSDGSGDNDCDDGDDDGDDSGSDSKGGEDGKSQSGDDSGTATITITVTLPASGAVTKPPSTTTLNVSQASSLLASLTASGSASIVTVTPISPSSSADGNARNGVVAPSPSLIHLTSTPFAAVATPSLAVISAPAAVDGYSY